MWWFALALAAPSDDAWNDDGTDRRLFYERNGVGPTWIFVEGDGSRRQPFRRWLWEETVQTPLRGTVVRPVTLANEGRRRDWRESTLHDRVEDVRAVISELTTEGEPIILVGHSAGADVAVRVAQIDSRVTGVVSVGGGVHPLDVVVRETGVPESFVDSWVESVRAAPADEPMGRRTAAFWQELFDPDQTTWWRALDVPFLVVYGEHDTVVPVSLADRAATDLAGSQGTIVVIPDVGHDLVSSDDTWAAVQLWADDALRD